VQGAAGVVDHALKSPTSLALCGIYECALSRHMLNLDDSVFEEFPGSALSVGYTSNGTITVTHLKSTVSIPSSDDPMLVISFIEEIVLLLHGKELAEIQTETENGTVFKDLLHDVELFELLKALASIRQNLTHATQQVVTLSIPKYDDFLTHGAWEDITRKRKVFVTAMADFIFPDVPSTILEDNPSLAFVKTHDGRTHYVAFDTLERTAFRISVDSLKPRGHRL
jgi:hypothetical protein